ncbi:MAG: cation:proton antiporter [Acidimicrobiales bacterium]
MPLVFAAGSTDDALIFLELGAIFFGLAILARVADRLGFSPIPFYMAAGLFFGEGGFVELDLSREFVDIAAEIGVILLLLTLGLEYTAEELGKGLRRDGRAGLVDLVLNGGPGFAAGMLLGWDATSSLLLAGITYISSSGIIAKLLGDLNRLGNRETPTVLSVLVIEDLVMALYLPVVGVLLAGDDTAEAATSLGIALAVVLLVLFAAMRYGETISAMLHARTDEGLLLGVLGLTLIVAGAAQSLQVSAAIGAFLVGIAITGNVEERAQKLVLPLRDLFAATFFVLFSLQVDPGEIPGVLLPAAILAVITAATKMGTGWFAASRAGIALPGRVRAGSALIARGEFSIVIAGLGVAAADEAGIVDDLGPVATAYVLILAIAGPVFTRFADDFSRWLVNRRAPEPATA